MCYICCRFVFAERNLILSFSDNGQPYDREHLNLPQYILMTCLILIILISNKMISQLYSTEVQLKKVSSFNTGVPFLDLDLFIVSSKFYDEQDDFNFGVVNLPFRGEDVPHCLSGSVYILHLIHFVLRVCPNVSDFNNRNQFGRLSY